MAISDFIQLEDLDEGHPLLPPGDPKLRAHCRLWADHVRLPPYGGFVRARFQNTDLIDG